MTLLRIVDDNQKRLPSFARFYQNVLQTCPSDANFTRHYRRELSTIGAIDPDPYGDWIEFDNEERLAEFLLRWS